MLKLNGIGTLDVIRSISHPHHPVPLKIVLGTHKRDCLTQLYLIRNPMICLAIHGKRYIFISTHLYNDLDTIHTFAYNLGLERTSRIHTMKNQQMPNFLLSV